MHIYHNHNYIHFLLNLDNKCQISSDFFIGRGKWKVDAKWPRWEGRSNDLGGRHVHILFYEKKIKILNVSNTVSHVIKNHEALGTQCNH